MCLVFLIRIGLAFGAERLYALPPLASLPMEMAVTPPLQVAPNLLCTARSGAALLAAVANVPSTWAFACCQPRESMGAPEWGCRVGARAGCVPSGSWPHPLPSQVFSVTKGGWESNTNAIKDIGVALIAARGLSSQQWFGQNYKWFQMFLWKSWRRVFCKHLWFKFSYPM